MRHLSHLHLSETFYNVGSYVLDHNGTISTQLFLAVGPMLFCGWQCLWSNRNPCQRVIFLPIGGIWPHSTWNAHLRVRTRMSLSPILRKIWEQGNKFKNRLAKWNMKLFDFVKPDWLWWSYGEIMFLSSSEPLWLGTWEKNRSLTINENVYPPSSSRKCHIYSNPVHSLPEGKRYFFHSLFIGWLPIEGAC